MSATVIYYTSNKEDEKFEIRIRNRIRMMSYNLPIISVSQHPIDFGENICVGEVGASNFNLYRQVQIAVMAAKTDFIITTEADCLYPPDYFSWLPSEKNVCYRNENIYIIRRDRGGFHKKTCSTFSQVVGRDFYLKCLDKIFKGKPDWDADSIKEPGEIFKKERWKLYRTTFPCISFKTGRGLRMLTQMSSSSCENLPYWGTAEEVRKKFFGEL